MQFSHVSDQMSHLQIFGDVQTVLQGKVDSTKDETISLQNLPYGLGAMRGDSDTQSRAFYNNPNDVASSTLCHTHVMKQKKGEGSEEVQTVYHLLSHSELVSGQLFLYPLCP